MGTRRKKKPKRKGKIGRRAGPYPFELRLKVVKLHLEDGYAASLIAQQFGMSFQLTPDNTVGLNKTNEVSVSMSFSRYNGFSESAGYSELMNWDYNNSASSYFDTGYAILSGDSSTNIIEIITSSLSYSYYNDPEYWNLMATNQMSEGYLLGYYQVTGNGYIYAEVDYEIQQTFLAEGIGDYVKGSTWAELGFRNITKDLWGQNDVDRIDNYFSGPISTSMSRTGTLHSSVQVFDGDWVVVNAAAVTHSTSNSIGSAPVPEPSTITLLGVGLLGLVGASRKKFMKKG